MDSNSHVEVTLDHEERQLDADRFARMVQQVLEDQNAAWTFVSVVLTDAATVHKLNREYLAHDYETDVLSFNLETPGEAIEGEVYVDLDTAARVAPEFDTSFEQEAARYVIHGVLHLCGHNDTDDTLRDAMRRLENRYLQLL